MRKTLVLLLFALLAIGAAYGQYLVNFEGATETKTGYASGTVNLSGLDWDMTEAVIGNLAADFYMGTKSARMRGYGTSSMTMLADKANGIGTISFQYRRYGTDSQVDWKVEYSSDNGTSWTQIGSAFTAPASDDIQTFSETVNVAGSIRVRIKRATESGTTNKRMNIDDITITDYTGGAPTPIISISGTLSAFSAWTGTPSDAQSYTVSGSNLTANIAVVAPTGYALSTDQTTWTATLSLASTFNGLVYVRMTGATAGEFNGNITHNSTGAAEVTQAVSGTVSDPVPTILPVSNLTAFTTLVGTPSATQQYNLTAAFLTANITITAPAGFEISTDGSNYSAGLSVTPNYNGQIYVRLTGTTAGTFNGNILHSSTGATDVNVAVSGAVTNPAVPTTFLEENFNYTAGTLLTSNGWTAHGGAGTQPLVVGDTGLVYPSYPAVSGLSGQTVFSGSAEDVHRTFTQQTSGNVYASFLVNAASLPNTSGDYFVHFGPNSIGTDFKGRLHVQKDESNNLRFGVSKAGTAIWTDYTYSLNQTYLIVLKYVINSGTTNDEVFMWVNPTISGSEPAALLTASDVSGTDAANIGSIAIRQGTNTPIAKIDGIRVTNDWALLWDGTPPPTPVIIASTTELDPLAAIVNSPSDEIRSYTLYGTDLQGPITIVAPTGFQVSTSETEGWAAEIAVPSSFNSTIYVRMFPEVSGEFTGSITHNSPNATQVDIVVSGEGIEPPTTWNITANLTAFSAEAGTASAAQSYTLSATNATENLALTVDAPFEISTSETEGFGSSLSLAPTFNGTIWVRMNSATAGPFTGDITHNTANASPYDLAVSGTATLAPGNYATDLFFSEYLEGSNSNKAIEIFNGTGVPVDLSIYTAKLANSAASWGTPFALSGILANNDVFVITNAGAALTEITSNSDMTSTLTYFNGDDAVGLFKNDVLIDIIGTIGTDPGTAWPVAGVANATAEHTLIRKPTVAQGNIDWASSAGTDADNSEWIVQAQNYVADLGSHTFTPGMEIAATPEISPAGGLYYTPVEITITAATPGSVIRYTTDGSEPDETSSQYTAPFQVTATSTVKARAYATGFAPSAVAIANYSFPVAVANIAALRAMPTGATVYQLTGEAILTFQQSTRNQKYIQDATAAIVIDDAAGVITTAYNLYDGITGITGTLGLYNGLLQFTPVADPGAATSTGNVVVPELRTLASLTSADQAKLIKVENVMVDATNVNFGTYAENINVTDPTATLVMRTFPATDYSSTAIPTVAQDVICLVGEFSGTMQISPRFLSDFSNHAGGTLEAPIVSISVVGNTINLSWDAVAGATSYRVEGSSDPYGTFTPVTTVTGTAYNGAAEGMKFFKVIAIQ
ncbi:MAG: hypothetical protein CVU49_09675 [Candidatus Cloacimonetes bacterium HGW-Cloacimonetes-2]|jgi:hypothetical protein|nr:MAG: hypothetical protein CVU49_09675 [Candidatus Cloacimonetes bacterium HGW-Cloacimonetes-2]